MFVTLDTWELIALWSSCFTHKQKVKFNITFKNTSSWFCEGTERNINLLDPSILFWSFLVQNRTYLDNNK